MTTTPDQQLDFLLTTALKMGATAAEVILASGSSTSVTIRNGTTERIERSDSQDVGLRVFIGQQVASASSTDVRPDALKALVERTVAMARVAPEDPYAVMATPAQLAKNAPDLDLNDPASLDAKALLALATEAEDAARAVSGISNSDGADASHSRSRVLLRGSNGLNYSAEHTDSGFSVCVLAGSGTGMERDYDYASAVYAGDLPPADAIGRNAGEQTVARLNPRRVATGHYPVIFAPRVAASLLRSFLSAINGSSIARGTSFLKDSLHKPVFGSSITIFEDPHRLRGQRSRPLDAEGLPTTAQKLIDGGILQDWLLDLSTAKRLGLQSNGHAVRGMASPPSPSASNVYLCASTTALKDLLSLEMEAFYVTDLMGMGVNLITGDYSQGASGFWLSKGERAYPVSEVTIAGKLQEMFMSLIPADDLVFKTGIDSPTVLIPRMMVAGA
ncbi:MAG: TldD/PmbA family protein [Holosporales bacterium]